MLNDNKNCTGENTQSQETQRSILGYFLVTDSIYKRFDSMKIDEEKENYDLPDHNLMEREFKVIEEKNTREVNGQSGNTTNRQKTIC